MCIRVRGKESMQEWCGLPVLSHASPEVAGETAEAVPTVAGEEETASRVEDGRGHQDGSWRHSAARI